jgi:energy-coupling factor transporter ATP-binding protein EcfA2
MKFNKLILANWANIPNQEYFLTDLVFLTGETGVGKSTMLDAIQTLMTANKKGIVQYNAGQDEAQNKKRDKEYRTLQGYFAGEDRFKFSRPNGCRSTIALSFKSSKNEEKSLFTALLTGSVSFEESKNEKKPVLDSLHFFIIKNHELSQNDILDENSKLLDHRELYKNLSLKYERDNVIHCVDKSDYLNTLYGNLWGKSKTTSTVSEKAARAFSNFIHARPVDNINAFVRNEFLTPKDMKDEVSSLSDTIRALDKLKKDAKEIEESIFILSKLESKLSAVIKKWHILGEEHFIYSHYEVLKQENKIINDEKKYIKLEREIKRIENRLRKLNLEEEALNSKIIELTLAQNSNDKVKELNEINKKIEDIRKDFNSGISSTILITGNIEKISRDISSIFLQRERFPHLCIILSDFKVILDKFSSNSFNQYFLNNNIDSLDLEYQVTMFKELLDGVIDTYSSFIGSIEFNNEKEAIDKSYQNSIVEKNSIDEKIRIIDSEIKILEETRFFCPSVIQESYDVLKKMLPNANAHLLYEYVELLDDDWREAIEGFIGNNRFSLIVSSEYEKEAIDIVRQNDLKIKIIQGKKVLEELEYRGKSLAPESIVNLLKISNDKAQAYLISTYGDVLQIASSAELTKAKRGITIDCKAASGNLLFTCNLKDKRFIFGEEAQRLTLHKMKEEKKNLFERSNQIAANIDISRNIYLILNNFTKDKKIANLEDIAYINANYNKYRDSLQVLKLIDTSEFEEITNEINSCKNKQKEIKSELDNLNQEVGSNKRSYAEKYAVEKSNLQILEDKKKYLEINRNTFSLIYDKLVIHTNMGFENYEKNIIDKIDINIQMKQPENLLTALSTLWHEFDTYHTVQILANKLALPNALSFDEIEISIQHFGEIINFKNELINRIDDKNNSLTFKYKNEIENADKEFKNTFLNDFCHAIYVNIKQGEHLIDRLNDTLKKHKFGSETFKIKRAAADEELKRYQEYFKVIHESKNTAEEGSLFEELSKQGFEDISNSLLSLFMDNEKHIQELVRISDYRNYNNYDIFQEIDGMSISLSRNGKNSGGQGETSYYIIRSINLQSALRPSETNSNSLESIIIDESFLKSNEKRSKEILSYLNESLGFQIICAMPTKNVGTFYEIDSTNYHFVQFPLGSSINGELDYKTFVEFKNRNNIEIKRLYEDEEKTLFDEVLKQADELYS